MIWIVLVNWNGWQDTIECLESLLRINDNGFRVIVCDNGSNDSSVEHLVAWADGAEEADMSGPPWTFLPSTRRFPASLQVRQPGEPVGSELITVIRTGENSGFAGGCNIGIEYARSDPECSYVFLLNNDTVVLPDILYRLKLKMTDPSLAACGGTLCYYDMPEIVQGVGGFWKRVLARGGHLAQGMNVDVLPETEKIEPSISYVMGAALFMRRDLVDRIQKIWEGYFLYFEEMEIASYLLADERLGWCPGAMVYHKEGGSIGTNSRARPSDTSLYYLSVNLLRFYYRHDAPLLPLAIVRLLWESIKHLFRYDLDAFQVVMIALFDFLTGKHRTGGVILR